MPENEIMCPRCKENYTYDTGDIRPFIYHTCEDGVMFGVKNPNNIKKPRQYSPALNRNPRKGTTLWQEFD